MKATLISSLITKLRNKWRQEFEVTKIIHKGEEDRLVEVYQQSNLSQTKSFNLKLIQIIRELLLSWKTLI